MKEQEHIIAIEKKIKLMLGIFIGGLIFSGLSAIPLLTELSFLEQMGLMADHSLGRWLQQCFDAIRIIHNEFPFVAYGTDWLAFGHFMIAVVFIGPLIDPVRNRWVIHFGMIACISVIPMSMIAGYFRSIPFFWQMIDCSFGIIGLALLTYINAKINQLEKLIYAPYFV